MQTAPKLIQCGDHSWAPYSIICVHLMTGESHEWIKLDSDHPEVEYDFVCPSCDEWHADEQLTEDQLNLLKVVCIHCIRQLRQRFDPTFEE